MAEMEFSPTQIAHTHSDERQTETTEDDFVKIDHASQSVRTKTDPPIKSKSELLQKRESVTSAQRQTTITSSSSSKSKRMSVMTYSDLTLRKFKSLIYSRSHMIMSLKEKETLWEFLKTEQGQQKLTQPNQHRYVWLKCSGAYNLL